MRSKEKLGRMKLVYCPREEGGKGFETSKARKENLQEEENEQMSDKHLFSHADFPGGLVVKNPPANAGDKKNVGMIPWFDP